MFNITKTAISILAFGFTWVLFMVPKTNATNLLPNGSFEVTTIPDIPDCWNQYLGPKKLRNWFSLWYLDRKEVFHGHRSLCLDVRFQSVKGKLYVESCLSQKLIRKAKLFKFKKGQNYVLSLYMRSSRPDMLVRVFFQRNNQVRVGRVWKRYHVVSFISLFEKLRKVKIVPLNTGKLWIDAVQLEPGKQPTKFTPSPYDKRFVKLPQPKKFSEVSKEQNELDWEGEISKEELLAGKKGGAIVSIDPIRRCFLVHGSPFFFFAGCFMRAHLYKKRWADLLDMLKGQGYTAVIASFSCRWNDSHAEIPEILKFLDMAQERNLMVIPWINPNAIKIKGGKFKEVKNHCRISVVLKEYKKEISRLVPYLKNHPAILAWYLCDEPGNPKLLASKFTKKLVDFTKKLDKSHPVYINYGNLSGDYRVYDGKVPGDLVSMTQYPLPIYPITRIAENTGMEYAAGNFRKPVVLWLQLWSGLGRYPTPDEFSCMAYLAAIYGATGFQTWPMVPSSKILWSRVKTVICEMKELTRVLYEPNRIPLVIKGSDYVHVVAKRLNGKYWIIAVNTLASRQEVAFKIPQIDQIVKVVVKFENRTCKREGNIFWDSFAPYERHVYVVSERKTTLN